MDRKESLYQIINDLDENIKIVGYSLVDRMVYLEQRLLELEKVPFYQVNPKNLYQQRELPARKVYVGLLQQYNIAVKTLLKIIGVVETDESADEFKKYLMILNERLTNEA